jgi:hypothetical protein
LLRRIRTHSLHTCGLAVPPSFFTPRTLSTGRVRTPKPHDPAFRRPQLQGYSPVRYPYTDLVGKRYIGSALHVDRACPVVVCAVDMPYLERLNRGASPPPPRTLVGSATRILCCESGGRPLTKSRERRTTSVHPNPQATLLQPTPRYFQYRLDRHIHPQEVGGVQV